MSNCLCCHLPLEANEQRYHSSCAKALFGKRSIPQLKYSLADMERIAAEWLATHAAVTGVQPKLSLYWQKEKGVPRLTIIGALEGEYILKLPYAKYPQMPALEALCMNLARACGIPTIAFGLIPLLSGERCYITKRMDRTKEGKVAMEDFCQLSQRLTEDKYKGSHEQLAKMIRKHSSRAMLDVVRFYETVVFSFLIGNNDMHLKNFSLYAPEGRFISTPAYDLIASQLLLPSDDEDLALNLNGKKKKLNKEDFEQAIDVHLSAKAKQNLFERIAEGMKSWPELITRSFITEDLKVQFRELIASKCTQLNLHDGHGKAMAKLWQ